jgi:hypothetical protein
LMRARTGSEPQHPGKRTRRPERHHRPRRWRGCGGGLRGGGHRGLPGRVEEHGPAQHAVPGVPQGRPGVPAHPSRV